MAAELNPTQEVRFAVVMYGGVSLACYINGVSQELFHLVRATAEDPDHPGHGRAELSGTQEVYRKLGQLLRRGEPPPDTAAGIQPDAPIRTRFRIDILSGTSAGGINAIFLAKGLANDQPISQLKDLWIKEGDISTLLNDNRAHGEPAASLLDGKQMLSKLLEALDGMDKAGNERAKDFRSPNVEELDLYITTTDIRGLALPVRLADKVVEEKRHRKVFHFLYSNAESSNQPPRNDFLKVYNPFLAFAARCTSAFPVAFEPGKLAGLEDLEGVKAGACTDPLWDSFLREYLRNETRDKLKQRAFGDGGYLDNKPFSYAIKGLQQRRADLPAERKLIYIEPSPERLTGKPKGSPEVDVVENVQAALLTLPHYETIREDLQGVLERNQLVERVAVLTSGIEEDLEERGFASLPPPPAWNTWGRKDLTTMIATLGITFGGYHRLKVATLVDELARAIALASGLNPDSADGDAVRYLVHAWREECFYRFESDRGGRPETENKLLVDYDLSYRIRRLLAVRGKIDALSSLDTQHLEILQSLVPLVKTALENRLGEANTVCFRIGLEELQGVVAQLREEGRDVPKELLDQAQGRQERLKILADKYLQNPEYKPLHAKAMELVDGNSPFHRYVHALGKQGATEVEARLKEWEDLVRNLLGEIDATRKRSPVHKDQEEAWQGAEAALKEGKWPAGANGNSFKKAFQAQLRKLKPGLSEAFARLRLLQREFWDPDRQADGSSSEDGQRPFAQLQEKMAWLKSSLKELQAVLKPSTDAERKAKAAELFRANRADFECVTGFIKEHISTATWDVSKQCKEVLYAFNPAADAVARNDERIGHLLAQACARHYYDHYDQYDLVLFPVLYQTGVGEVAKVDIFRISPDDAERDAGTPKLAGTALFNFGGFLDRGWRFNDILWGRLDGAQRLISALLPNPAQESLRLQLVKDAHDSILQEDLSPSDQAALVGRFVEALVKASAGASDDEVLDRLRLELGHRVKKNEPLRTALRKCLTQAQLRDHFQKHYEVYRTLDAERMVRLLARSTQIIGEILEGLSQRYPIGKSRAAWVTRFGQIFWGLVEAAVPRSYWNLFVRHFLKLLYLLEASLLVAGTLLVNTTVQSFALLTLAGTLTVHLVLMLLGEFMRGKALLLTVLKYLLAFLVVGLVILGVFQVVDMIEYQNERLLNRVKGLSKPERLSIGALFAAGAILAYGIWKGLTWLWRKILGA